MKRPRFIILLSAFALLTAALAAPFAIQLYRALIGFHVKETIPPALPPDLSRPAILVFSKTNRYRHGQAIAAVNALAKDIGVRRKWSVVVTENGAVHNPRDLARFDAIVWNNVTGDVLTPAQRAALRAYVRRGGGFVGLHASGDPGIVWPWYVESVIGARFTGHPKNPQFQSALLVVEDTSHPATEMLPKHWRRTDEWYSFDASVRSRGFHVLASLDEASYIARAWNGADLRMGGDHPVMWWHCEGRGRAFYSAMGHKAEAFAEPLMRQSLEGAIAWAARRTGAGCN
jgi:type 1 glutamine amidotransferase